VQRPHPPILIGAGGPRMLALAAREADIVSVLVGMSPAGEFDLREVRATALDAKVALLRASAGDRFDRLELHLLVQQLAVGDEAIGAGAALANRWHLTPDEVTETPYALIGTVGEIAAQLLARRERFGFSYYTVRDRDMAAFAPVVAALRGR